MNDLDFQLLPEIDEEPGLMEKNERAPSPPMPEVRLEPRDLKKRQWIDPPSSHRSLETSLYAQATEGYLRNIRHKVEGDALGAELFTPMAPLSRDVITPIPRPASNNLGCWSHPTLPPAAQSPYSQQQQQQSQDNRPRDTPLQCLPTTVTPSGSMLNLSRPHVLVENARKQPFPCYLCYMSGVRTGASKNISKSIYGCIGCQRGYHVNCFAALHHPEFARDANPEGFVRMQGMLRRYQERPNKRHALSTAKFGAFGLPFDGDNDETAS